MNDPHQTPTGTNIADGGQGSAAYLAWKAWEEGKFGAYKPAHAVYYAAELALGGERRAGRLLEIGFGQGGFMQFARECGHAVSGVEANPLLVEAARQAGFAAFASLDALPADSAFDVVTAFDVLEHIPQEALPDVLRKIAACLRPGGVFIARFPNGDSPFGRPYQHGDITHVTTLGSGKVMQLAQLSGFELVRCGASPEPIRGAGLVWGAYRVLVLPLRWLLEKILVRVYFPRGGISFSPNLSVVLRKPAVR